MGKDSNIEWTDHTLNCVRGCSKVELPIIPDKPEAGCHPSGCTFCYAESMSKRNPAMLGVWGEEGTRVLASESMLREPLRWNEEARKAGRRARVFAYSLGDVFETPLKPENAAICNEARRRLFDLIRRTPWLLWMLLTKRPENIMALIPEDWRKRLPDNVMVGTSVENQPAADLRIPHLLSVPGRRFLSMEPLLERVVLTRVHGLDPAPLPAKTEDGSCSRCGCPWSRNDSRLPRSPRGHTCPPGFEAMNIDLVIIGGESGGNARPCHIEAVRDLVAQCLAAGVHPFVKQLGARPLLESRPATDEEQAAHRRRYPKRGKITRVETWLNLKHHKGGDIEEFPADLRIREVPEIGTPS